MTRPSNPTPRFPSLCPHAWLLAAGVLAGCGDSFTDDFGASDDASMDNPGHDLAGRDLAIRKGADLAQGGGGPRDLAGQPPADLTTTPITGTVGPKGGTVSRLFFGFSGDARPSQCNEHNDYPSAILDKIFSQLNDQGAQFSMDLGDHMFVCQNGSQNEANTQMGLYMSSMRNNFGNKTTFLTLGNHDCVSMNNPHYCGVNGFSTPNYVAFMNALKSENISNTPYYSFEVKTDHGLAIFVVVADNAWSGVEQQWLQNTLTDADARAQYIFIFRHHPLDNTDWPDFHTISAMVKSPKHLTMLFEGHTHEWRLDTFNDRSGRTSIVGNAGAPLAIGFTWYGYGTVEQLDTGNLDVRLYDQATKNQQAAYQISPQ